MQLVTYIRGMCGGRNENDSGKNEMAFLRREGERAGGLSDPGSFLELSAVNC